MARPSTARAASLTASFSVGCAWQMRAKSSDTKFFATIKTPADVDKTMGTTLTGWLSPVQKQCS